MDCSRIWKQPLFFLAQDGLGYITLLEVVVMPDWKCKAFPYFINFHKNYPGQEIQTIHFSGAETKAFNWRMYVDITGQLQTG